MRRLDHCNIVSLLYFFYTSGEKKVWHHQQFQLFSNPLIRLISGWDLSEPRVGVHPWDGLQSCASVQQTETNDSSHVYQALHVSTLQVLTMSICQDNFIITTHPYQITGLYPLARNLPPRYQTSEPASWSRQRDSQALWLWQRQASCARGAKCVVHLLQILQVTSGYECDNICWPDLLQGSWADIRRHWLHHQHWRVVSWMCVCWYVHPTHGADWSLMC